MRAKFIGKDGSMGFLNGKIYEIETYVKSQLFRTSGLLWVKVKHSPLKCPYSRMETFLANWELLPDKKEELEKVVAEKNGVDWDDWNRGVWMQRGHKGSGGRSR